MTDHANLQTVEAPDTAVPEPLTFPLSYSQERLWFLQQFDPGNSAYNHAFAVQLIGQLDVDVLKSSLQEIVKRHEILRTVFRLENGQPVQCVLPSLDLKLVLEDLRTDGGGDEVARIAAEEARKPFDLTTLPLMRVMLLRSGPVEHVVIFNFHHIVFDAWSGSVFWQELTVLYDAFLAGAESPLPELSIQYGDYATWQREWLQGEVLEQQLGYWTRQLAGIPEALELPTDRPRAAAQSSRGAVVFRNFRPKLWIDLKELCWRAGVTMFVTTLAAFEVLLMRYSGQEDFAVGMPVANRNQEETGGLIGFFVNTLVMRAQLHGGPAFSGVLAQTRETSLEAFAHQDLPFEKLVEALHPERNASHSPVFQVLFTLLTMPSGGETAEGALKEFGGLILKPWKLETGTTKCDLVITLGDGPEGPVVELNYSSDLFDATTIHRMLDHYERLLEGVAADCTQRVWELPLLREHEEAQLKEWSGVKIEFPRDATITGIFEEVADGRREATAVEDGGLKLNYGQLNIVANRIARYLRRIGIAPESRVGICMERSAEMVAGILGILKAGGVYVPFDPGYPEDRLRFMIEDAGIKVLITRQDLLGQFPQTGVIVLCMDRDRQHLEAEIGEDLRDSGASAENLAYVMYTSGSTGRPKGIGVTHRNVVRLVRGTDYAQLAWSDRIAHASNPAFDAATFEVWGALLNGACLVVVPKEVVITTPRLAETLKFERITALFLTTALFNQIAREAPASLGCLRYALFGGEIVDPHAVRRVLAAARPEHFLHVYGPTEGTTFSSWHQICELGDETATVPIGRALANAETYVLDQQMGFVPMGVAGELHVGGDGLARGYWERPDLTAEAFVPHPFAALPGQRLYRTGDRVRYQHDGSMVFIGRIDNQIKLRGHRIELGEIEEALRHCEGVRDCAVMVRGGTSGDKQLVAYIAWRTEGKVFDQQELKNAARKRLPEYMVPPVFVEMESLPLNANGKVDRKALAEAGVARTELTDSYVAPRTVVEEMLAEIWSEVLGIEKIGIRNNFFEMGGHSLLATKTVSRIAQAFQIDLPLRHLFEGPTIAELATTIEAITAGGEGKRRSPILPRAARNEDPPLSYAQERLWFLDQFQPGSNFYNVPISFGLRGEIDVHLLQASLEGIVRRHEILRTRFVMKNGSPVQQIESSVKIPLAVFDLRGLAAEEQHNRARRVIGEDARKPFDLGNGPTVRGTLVRLSNQENLLGLTMHHIVTDEWSLGVMSRELTLLYEAFQDGRESPLEDLPIQYADYAVWQREWLQGEVLEAQLGYWRKQLAGMPGVLELPASKPRPAVQSFRGALRSRPLPIELWAGLKALGRKEDATPFMTLLSLFQVLLMRYSGQTDFGVGVPVANRSQAETEELIGFFVNTLVMRAQLEGEPSFKELLKRTRQSALSAYANQDVPFEKLLTELHTDRDLSRTPLFQVMFQIQNALLPAAAPGGEEDEESTAKCDLVLTVSENDQEPVMVLNYVRDLFESVTMQRMLEHLELLIEAVIADPEAPVSAVPLLTAAEAAEMEAWNQTQMALSDSRTIVQIFEESARVYQDLTAVALGELRLSYGELNRRVNQLAHYLMTLGVGPEVMVAICTERSPEMVVGMLGIMKAGGAYVPLDPSYPQERLRQMVMDSGVPVLLAQQQVLRRLPETPARVVCLDRDWELISHQPESNPSPASRPENLAYVIFTSGSSGTPKGVMVQHSGLMNLITWHQSVYGITAQDKAAQTATAAFDACTWELWPYLASGASIHVANQDTRSSPSQLLQWMIEKQITISFLVTPLAEALLAAVAQEGAKTCLRLLLTGGDKLSAYPAPGLSFDVFNHYGPTEDTVVATATAVTPGKAGTPHIGRPIANTEVFIVDPALRRVTVGAPGELCLAGAGLARGYHHHAALTAEKFVPNPFAHEPGSRIYRTGDLVRFRHDGNIEFLGRIDEQVKIRGFRVELGEVEESLRGHEEVRQTVVVLRKERNGNQRLAAYFVAKEGSGLKAETLRGYLSERLPAYMVPSLLVPVQELPLTANGKVDRKALPEPAGEEIGSREILIPCRTELEQTVAGIWQELLGVERVGLDNNFFELGGHSLLVIQMKARFKEVMGLDLPVVDLFTYPTIRSLAEHISRKDEARALRASFERRANMQKSYLKRRRQVAERESAT